MRLRRRDLEQPVTGFPAPVAVKPYDDTALLKRIDALEAAVRERDARIEGLLKDLAARPEPPEPEEKVTNWVFDVVKDREGVIMQVEARAAGSAPKPKQSVADIMFSKG